MARRLTRHPVLAALLVAALVLAAVWAVKLVQLRRSVDANAGYWSQPRGQTGGLLYVALGDSAAQSIGASRPEHGYVALLAARLRATTGQPVEVVNLSRSGARMGDVLDSQLRAVDDLGREPDIVTVAIGGNDIRAYDRATFAEQVERLTAALPDGTYLADAPYFMHGRWERDSQQAADLLTTSVVARGLRPVALHEALRAQGARAMLTQFAADWFHPNNHGHKVWADAFWTRIRPHIGELYRSDLPARPGRTVLGERSSGPAPGAAPVAASSVPGPSSFRRALRRALERLQ